MGRLVPVLVPVVKAEYGYTPFNAQEEKSPMPNAAILAGGAASMYGGTGLYNAARVKHRAQRGAQVFRQQFRDSLPKTVEASRKAKEFRAKMGPTPKTGVTGRLNRYDPIRAMADRRATKLEADAKKARAQSSHYANKVRQAREVARNPKPTQRAMIRSSGTFAAAGAGLLGWGAYKRLKEAQQS